MVLLERHYLGMITLLIIAYIHLLCHVSIKHDEFLKNVKHVKILLSNYYQNIKHRQSNSTILYLSYVSFLINAQIFIQIVVKAIVVKAKEIPDDNKALYLDCR